MDTTTFQFIVSCSAAVVAATNVLILIIVIEKNRRPRRRSRYINRMEDRLQFLEQFKDETDQTMKDLTAAVELHKGMPSILGHAGNKLNESTFFIGDSERIGDVLIQQAKRLQTFIEEIQLQISVK